MQEMDLFNLTSPAIGGCSPSQPSIGTLRLSSPPESPTCKDNKNLEEGLDISIGKCVAMFHEGPDVQRLKECSRYPRIFSGPTLKRAETIVGKKTLVSKVRCSSSVTPHCVETKSQIGMLSERQPKEAIWTPNVSRDKYLFKITSPSRKSAETMFDLLLWYGRSTFFGELREVANPTGLGVRRVQMLIVKSHALNGGAVTMAKNLLSWMNFEEILTFPTSCDGGIAILSEWRPKGTMLRFPSESGTLRAIYPRPNGTQNSMTKLEGLYYDD